MQQIIFKIIIGILFLWWFYYIFMKRQDKSNEKKYKDSWEDESKTK